MSNNFKELWNDPNFIDDTQKAIINFEVVLIETIIEARESNELTQQELAELAGLKQPALARIEKMKVTPRIDTVIKVLQPLGFTLGVVPLNEIDNQ